MDTERVLPDVVVRPDTDLPVRSALGSLLRELTGPGVAVLVAPPGSGKTTLVPLALAEHLGGRIVVAQPRRVAARAAAARMAALTGGSVGGAIGYSVRGERRVGPATRVEVVTTGLLVQRLQRDPELAGTAAVILDECHERHLDTDLALAFTVDVRANLRPDLVLLAMSATADADRLAAILGSAEVVRAEATPHPLEVLWCPPSAALFAPHGLWVDPRLLDHVATTVRRALAEGTGDVLVFLPGAGEIGAVTRRLSDVDADVLPLHGRLSPAAQDAAVQPSAGRRVILATAVAETSLTVTGVRAVVDAGLARVPRMDLARGLGSLVTVRVSRSIADQRAGRAAREAPGRVYRCWSTSDHERLPAQPEAEIAAADLTAFALALAAWGHPDGTGLALPDVPPESAIRVARDTLAALGAVDADGRITDRGRRLAAVGVHPRLARSLVDGIGLVGSSRAAEIVALLSDESLGGTGDDFAARWRALRTGVDRAAGARWRAEVRRLRTSVPSTKESGTALPDDLAAGIVVGLAFPERLARARTAGSGSYLMAGGTAAELAPGSGLVGSEWLAIAVADRQPGRAAARVRLAAPIDEATAREVGAALLTSDDEVGWTDGDVVARRVERLGAVVLTDRPLSNPDPATVSAALREGLRRTGLGLLSWRREASWMRERLAFCRHALGEPWPDVSDEALLDTVDSWLGPELVRARRRADLERIDVAQALRRLLPWDLAARFDELAPERVAVPSGARIRVDYSDPAAPTLAVKVQEAFGWLHAPGLAGGRVPLVLHLLSPAGRPAAVTSDLESFWRNGYRQVRAELRGRYPRHAWPEDGATASAKPVRRP